MPKVIVREYDNSTSATAAELNFAVVVPGVSGNEISGKTVTCFNDDGIYECRSQKAFEANVGLIGAKATEAKPPVLENLAESGESGIPIHNAKISTKKIIEYLNTTEYKLYTESDNSLGIGYLRTADHQYTLVEDVTKIEFENDQTKSPYSVIKVGNEGYNKNEFQHYGNQIAYELLGLGYTVLFKKIDISGNVGWLDQLRSISFWNPLKDKSKYNFRYIMAGMCRSCDPDVMNRIAEVAKFNNKETLETAQAIQEIGDDGANLSGRGDCIALLDIDETGVNPAQDIGEVICQLTTNINKLDKADTCSAIFGPTVQYTMSSARTVKFDGNKTFPASFHYLACAAQAFKRYAEWYAVAGYTRGVSDLVVEGTSINFGEIAINTLAPRLETTLNKSGTNYTISKAVNLILNERGSYYLWGNRTAYPLTSADAQNAGLIFSHFLNVRQLCTSIKKQVYTACKRATFEPNSDLLWVNFVNAITPLLNTMQHDQGIAGYKIERVANTKKALLTANIRIIPIEAVEDFEISIYLEDSLTGVNVSSSEDTAE